MQSQYLFISFPSIKFRLHFCRHTGMNLCYCNYCGKMYVKEIALKVHLRTHKHDNSSFECYLCHSKFDRKRGLSIHFTTTHIEEKIRNLKCQTCAKLFYKQSDLDLHIKVVCYIRSFSILISIN